ncbi:MAG TPA: class I SAM-dependent methyltransferase [Candidatus Saccharimonadales bacterium]|nr:class I SAM-dependent methyltransferase [Candidatus Saccharimonadales bacterium]
MLMNKTEFWLMNNPIRRASMRLEARKLRRMSPAQSLDRVLEIGSGEGQGTKNILRYWHPKAVDAIDLDPKMIARAKRRLKNKRVSFNVGDAANLSFAKDNTYDAIFDFGIIHHIPNWRDCLKELHRVLKPGGYLHIEDGSIEAFTRTAFGRFMKRILDHPYEQMYTKATFEAELAKLGFKLIEMDELSKVHMFWKVLQKPR